MKNTLAENLLRFAPKNLDAKTIEKLQQIAEQTTATPTAATPKVPAMVSQIPGWPKIAAWFKTEAYVNKRTTVALASGDFLYQAEPAGSDFNLTIYQAQQCQYGTFPFICLQRYASLSTDGMGNIKAAETTPMQPELGMENVSNNMDAGIQQVNDNWNVSIPVANVKTARQHIKLRKPALQDLINNLKTRTDMPTIAQKLKDTAKGAYDEIMS